MKARFLALLGVVMLFAPMRAAVPARESADKAYADAVSAYLRAAEQQLKAVRTQIDSETNKAPGEIKNRYQPVYEHLHQCDQRLAKLKDASQADFDKLKADYEHAIGELNQSCEAVKRARTAASP